MSSNVFRFIHLLEIVPHYNPVLEILADITLNPSTMFAQFVSSISFEGNRNTIKPAKYANIHLATKWTAFKTFRYPSIL